MSIRSEFVTSDGSIKVAIDAKGDGHYRLRVGENTHDVVAQRMADGRLVFELDGRAYLAMVAKGAGGSTHVRIDGHTYVLRTHEGRRRGSGAGGSAAVEAPMTGTVVQIIVAVGDRVVRGQSVGVLTAMKMEHKLLAGVDGVVSEVGAVAGATVEQGTVLVRIEPEQEAV